MLEKNGALRTYIIARLFIPDVEECKLVVVTGCDSKGLPTMAGIGGRHQISESCVAHFSLKNKI